MKSRENRMMSIKRLGNKAVSVKCDTCKACAWYLGTYEKVAEAVKRDHWIVYEKSFRINRSGRLNRVYSDGARRIIKQHACSYCIQIGRIRL